MALSVVTDVGGEDVGSFVGDVPSYVFVSVREYVLLFVFVLLVP